TLSRDPHLLVIALTEWTQRDLPAAIDVSLKESAVFANLFRALSKLKPERIEAAYAYLLEKGADKTSIMFGIIFRAMAEYDPEMATHRAIEFTLSIPEGDLAGMGEGIWINSVMAEWYNQDPDAASQWA